MTSDGAAAVAVENVNPYVFMVGCLRSGTTMLRHMVDAHPQLAIVNETQWLPRWYLHQEHYGVPLTPAGNVTPELVAALPGFHRFSRLNVTPAELQALLNGDGPVSYADFVSRVFTIHGRKEGKRLVGEKSPGYARYLPTIQHLWPRARIVNIIRDGRDVCLSVTNWYPESIARTVALFPSWAEDPITTAALWWEWHVRLAADARATLGERLLEVRYEAVVEDPAIASAAICDFLGLPYDDAMLRFHERHATPAPALKRGPGMPVTRGLRDWRRDMPAGDQERFEAAAGELLEELGYERAATPTSSQLAHARRLRAAFAEQALARHRPVPEAWTSL